MPSVILKRGKDRRLIVGHCWVYQGEIDKITGEPGDGDPVDIRDHKDRFLGRGLLNTRSRITVRRFTTEKEEIDRDFFRRRIEAALEYRRETTLIGDANTFRVISSEGDLLPGLIVDQYTDHLVLQALTLGIDQRKKMLVELLREMFQPQAIVERSDVPSRKLEGLGETKGVLFGETEAVVRLQFDHFSVEVNLLEDQKTGFFLDQRANYAEVARRCMGKRVLDCFSYHGGFALAAAGADAQSVEAVEISEPAVARARKNAELNGLTGRIEFVGANAFDLLKKYDGDKRRYDVIVLDPPSFTRTKQNVDDAVRGYKEINLRALKMLPPGGLLATFTCSHHIGGELFKSIVLDAAADARKTLRLVDVLTQSPDHPILPAVPETEYLRGLLLQVM
ncbi:MAG TPA: class I SAM-dependent rRNA methyltransferase [Verrucomicrobiae bacterium]|nr:class I SAM-dependent rRNA methyltransferase [Verrucomicrobiae bacterium]